MQELVATAAKQLGISAELIAPRKDLSSVIIGGESDSRLFRGWRKDVVGDEIAARVRQA